MEKRAATFKYATVNYWKSSLAETPMPGRLPVAATANDATNEQQGFISRRQP
jgi:hypothetical protein